MCFVLHQVEDCCDPFNVILDPLFIGGVPVIKGFAFTSGIIVLQHFCSGSISALHLEKSEKNVSRLVMQNNPSSAETSHAHL